ncbi:MAG: hypothetical protein AMXMBFR13_20870 [Phycisphaerae bacterium]
MKRPAGMNRGQMIIAIVALGAALNSALGADGTVTIPIVTGQSGSQPFAGHPGWVDIYPAGNSEGVGARVGEDAKFSLPDPSKPVALIALFDKIETPPVILPRWSVEPGNPDVPIAVEYACVPEGYPVVWDEKYKAKAVNFFQTLTPKCTFLYGVSVFDGPKAAEWGNQVHVSFHEGGPETPAMQLKDREGPDPVVPIPWDFVTSARTDQGLPRAGWRHGNVPVKPGQTCTIEVSGYRSHGGKNFELQAYVRPDGSDGYAGGECFADGKPTGGDLCCLVFGNGHGQLVENQIRSEEWELFIPRHRPSVRWGQSFTSHGVSLAGVSFWGSAGDMEPVECEIRIREEGPWGKLLKPTKTAHGHESPYSPLVRYPEVPRPLEGFESFYKKPCVLFQAAWMPDEISLQPGKEYYIELIPSRPVMLYADGDYYQGGYAYYEGLRVDRQATGQATLHSKRWTLAMNIVTYANPGGKPL